MSHRNRALQRIIVSLPALAALFVFLSPLSFVPVPWPDDSAFYFVAKELFSWPPRWVMLTQAPFEPSYAIHNFNTMPLYPVLIGLGRLVGIDGSHALKLWPLAAWALSGCLLVWTLSRKGLPLAAAFGVSCLFALDPTLRWASTLLRPESLIGLFGMALVLGLTFGFPEKLRARRFWDPEAALLALAAYSHFNAIHLLAPVLLAHARQPRRLARIGAVTTLYLLPWLATVLWLPGLFWQQMTTQWKRLAVGNGWLQSPGHALKELFQEMGSAETLPDSIRWAGVTIWLLILLAAGLALTHLFREANAARRGRRATDLRAGSLAPAAGWVLGALWLWHTKPEVWFTYYLHAAVWTLAGVGLLALARQRRRPAAWIAATCALVAPTVGILAHADLKQLQATSDEASWRWDRYHSLIDCVDEQLRRLESDLGHPKPFRVWAPTFPDILIELSRRHPDWELTRTNDFWERQDLAVEHGHQVEAVVVPETINRDSREIDGPQSSHPRIQSAWMTWREYFLNRLWSDESWKPRRWLCQRGRWQAFLFMKASE